MRLRKQRSFRRKFKNGTTSGFSFNFEFIFLFRPEVEISLKGWSVLFIAVDFISCYKAVQLSGKVKVRLLVVKKHLPWSFVRWLQVDLENHFSRIMFLLCQNFKTPKNGFIVVPRHLVNLQFYRFDALPFCHFINFSFC
jgi:hypothetical protein